MFGVRNLTPREVAGKNIIEIGACEVNGSLRPILESHGPASYVGVDITEGIGVDVVCDAEQLLSRFSQESFDIVLSTELIEHTRNWRRVLSNIKNLCAPGGTIRITTRSRGFHYHAYPNDYWRYEPKDIREIFFDCGIVSLMKDPGDPGVFLKARKPIEFDEKDLSGIRLYSIVSDRRTLEVTDGDFQSHHFRRLRGEKKEEGTQEKSPGCYPEPFYNPTSFASGWIRCDWTE
jgi:SAM-dependent methyltransferase